MIGKYTLLHRIKLLFMLFIYLSFCNCLLVQEKQKSSPKSDKIYQYSVFTALANRIYDGKLRVAEVKEKGDLGLGTFNGLNGEMIVLDGIVYQWLADGSIQLPANSELVPFANVTFFEEDQTFNLPAVSNYSDLKAKIEEKLPSKNRGYSFKVEANFTMLTCGSAPKQTRPYTKTLSDALINRPTFIMENISGTLVGFWYPEYIGKVNIPGFHLHFISNDRKHAGHVMEFEATNLHIQIDYADGFDIELPNTTDFDKTNFDLLQEYTNKK